MSHFYFAWVTKDDSTFDPDFIREDEDVYSVNIQHNEGDFPTMELDIRNPRVGLLTAGRMQWGWLSWTDSLDVNHPLFYGRLMGAPQSMQNEIVRVTFIARPLDFDQQKQALLEDAVANSPTYDPVWISDEDRLNPDAMLETVSAHWHIDRTTLQVTTSDIVTGEDGTMTFPDNAVFYDTLDVSYSSSPARQCVVEATVNWTQAGSGSFPLTNALIEAFKDSHITKGLASARGNPVSGNGLIALIPGKDMIERWPKPGASLGGGWTVTVGEAKPVGDPPLDPILVPSYEGWAMIQAWLNSPNLLGIAMRHLFERSPGFIVQVQPTWVTPTAFGTAHGPVDIVWFPIWLIAPKLEVGWDTARPRTETIRFTLEADVQPLLTDPGEEEIIRLSVGPADVDDYIGDSRRSRYFVTERGKKSVQSLIARARAALLARARAVDVAFDIPFRNAINLSCRLNGVLSDPRLPGNEVAGKVKSYSLTVDGDSGVLMGHVVLGCTVGRDGEVTETEGTPSYVEDGYVEDGYQVEDGATFSIPGYSDVTFDVGDYAFNDDGVNLFSVHRTEYLRSITVTGTIDEQQTEAEAPVGGQGQTALDVLSKVSGFTTNVEVRMRPILDNSFATVVEPYISELKIPRTIDLES